MTEPQISHDDLQRWGNALRAVFELLPQDQPTTHAAAIALGDAIQHGHDALDRAAYDAP